MTDPTRERPGFIGRLISRQAGRPTGLVGRFIGRAMIRDTRDTNEAALDLLAVQKGEAVLEIGFGQGRTIERLVGVGATVVGVEVSETMRSQATARNRTAVRDGRVELLVGDGVRLPVEDATADAALTAHTIYFWPEPATTMGEINRALRPGGRFVIAFRAGEEEVPARFDPDVYEFLDTGTVAGLVEDAGFIDVEVVRRPNVDPGYRWNTARRSS